jgi:hypothetical protein
MISIISFEVVVSIGAIGGSTDLDGSIDVDGSVDVDDSIVIDGSIDIVVPSTVESLDCDLTPQLTLIKQHDVINIYNSNFLNIKTPF